MAHRRLRIDTLRCAAGLRWDRTHFLFSLFFFFFWCLPRTIAFFFSLQSASCDTWEPVCFVGIAGFTYLLISVQVGRQRASPPSSHLKQERRRTRRIRAGKDDECHNSKSSRYLKAKYFNQPSSNSEPSLPSPPLSSPLLSSPLLSSSLLPLSGSVSQLQCDKAGRECPRSPGCCHSCSAASAGAVADGWRDGEVEKCSASEEEIESPVRRCLLL